MVKISLQPMGTIDQEILDFLKRELSFLWEVEINPAIEMPLEAYNPSRMQFDGSLLLRALSDTTNVILAITEADAYVEGLNYIFGLSWRNRTFISLRRLREEFYGLPENESLLALRALKESMHELGHAFGLNHCSDRVCVMYFSNSILDTDFKDWRYCGLCEWEIMRKLQIEEDQAEIQ